MGKVIAGSTISLDGYINDSKDSVSKLYSDFKSLANSESLQEAIKNTGAVLMGCNAFAMADDPDSYADSYEFQVPIFVLTHKVPSTIPKQNERLTFTFVTEGVQSAIRQVKSAAGDKDVQIIGGASTIQQSLNTGLVDELHLDVMPVVLQSGLRMFENINTDIELETSHVEKLESGRVQIRFKIKK